MPCFSIRELEEFNYWWFLIEGEKVDLCYEDPGKEVDLYISASAWEIISVWMGDIALGSALRSEQIELVGHKHLGRTFPRWFTLSSAEGIARADRTKEIAPV